MKIVVDTNILFSFFWKESITRKLILNLGGSLIAPNKAKEELKKYSNEIIKKLKINQEEFNNLLEELNNYVKFAELKEYVNSIDKIKEIAPDKDDCDFLALAYEKKCFVWSNDKVLKEQKLINILTTKDLLGD